MSPLSSPPASRRSTRRAWPRAGASRTRARHESPRALRDVAASRASQPRPSRGWPGRGAAHGPGRGARRRQPRARRGLERPVPGNRRRARPRGQVDAHPHRHACDRARGRTHGDLVRHAQARQCGELRRLQAARGAVTRSGCISSVFASGDPLAITGIHRPLPRGTRERSRTESDHGPSAAGRRRGCASRRRAPALPKGWPVYVAVDETTGNPLRIETRRGKRVFGGQNIDVIARTSKPPAGRPAPREDAVPPWSRRARGTHASAPSSRSPGRAHRPRSRLARSYRGGPAIPTRPRHRPRRRKQAAGAAVRRNVPRPLRPCQAGNPSGLGAGQPPLHGAPRPDDLRRWRPLRQRARRTAQDPARGDEQGGHHRHGAQSATIAP